MNKVILMGRLTRDPEVRYSDGGLAVARYTLAVNRNKKDGQQEADFISCIAFGKNAEFAEKYLRKGMQMLISGRIQTGSYTNKEGQKIYTTDVIVDGHEFTESKNSGSGNNSSNSSGQTNSGSRNNSGNTTYPGGSDGFMNIPDGIDEELPFN